MFSADTYIQRRKQLQGKVENGLLLFLGNEESPMNYTDNVYHYRQDSNFLYFFGIDKPGMAAVIDLDSGISTLYGNDISLDHVVWMGPQPSMQELADQVGAQTAPFSALEILLKEVNGKRKVHFLPPYRAANTIRLANWLDISLPDVARQHSEDFVKGVIHIRSYKTAEEIAEMEKALAITAEMHVTAMRMARPGLTEANLTGAVHGIAVGGGGNLAYPVILTVNGQTLHNHYHGNVLKSGQLVLGDFGAETDTYYAGDITRTFPVDLTFTDQQKAIYQIVLNAEMGAIEALRPGVTYREIHLLAAKIITRGLKDIGLMKGDVDAAVEAGAHGLFFPHGLGHMIGMDVHDMEDLGEDLVGYTDESQRSKQFGLRSLRLGRELEEGFVLTVEPGIYFIPQLMDQWEAEGKHTEYINFDRLIDYRDFGGIRIEDNLLITADGSRLLGPPIPKTIDEVEAIRRKGMS